MNFYHVLTHVVVYGVVASTVNLIAMVLWLYAVCSLDLPLKWHRRLCLLSICISLYIALVVGYNVSYDYAWRFYPEHILGR